MSETNTAPTTDAPKPTTERWVYCGRRFDDADAKMYFAYRTEAAVKTSRDLLYARQLTSGAIGGIYDLDVTRTGDSVSVVRDRYRWQGRIDDSKLLDEFAVLDAAALTAKESASAQKAASTSRLPSMTLDEIRAQLRKLPAPRRRAVLAVVLDLLSR